MRGRGVVLGLMAAGVLAAVAGPARAVPGILPPELVIGAGWTMAVNGQPGTGGAAVTVGALWPFASRWSFGVTYFQEDMGTEVSTLYDPNSGEPLGAVATMHRMTYGFEWRAETVVRQVEQLQWHLNGGFGYARQQRDVRGTVNDAVSGLTASAGLTALWTTKGAQAFGATWCLSGSHG